MVAAAVTVTAGQALYVTAAGTVGLCDNDVAAPVNVFAGLAGSSASAGQTIQVLISDPNLVLGGTLVKGTAVCTSPTAGGVTLTPGDNTSGSFVTVIGMARSTTVLNYGLGFAAGAAI